MVLSEIDAHRLFGSLDIAKDLVQKGVLRCLVEPHGDGPVTEIVEIGAYFCCVDEVCVLELQLVVFSVDEEAQHY